MDNRRRSYAGFCNCIILVLLLFLISCAEKPQETQILNPPVRTLVESPIISVTHTPTNIPTSVVPTATNIPELFINSTLVDENPLMCAGVPSCKNGEQPTSINDINGMDGVIIFYSGKAKQWQTFAEGAFQEVDFPTSTIPYDTIAFSPNAQRALAYSYHPEQKKVDHANLQLWGPDGQSKVIEIDMTDMSNYLRTNWAPTFSFQNLHLQWVNERIVLVMASYSETREYGFPTYQYAFYDIFLEEWLDELVDEVPNRDPFSWIIASPDMKTAIYKTMDYDFALWDKENQESFRVLPGIPGIADSDQFLYVSDWSPNNAYVTLMHFPDLVIFSKDGSVFRSIRDLYAQDEHIFFQKNVLYEWSPNSQQLAVSISTIPEDGNRWNSEVYVYDVELGKSIYHCSLGDEDNPIVDITWSPDGNFILTKSGLAETSSFRVFDLQNNHVYEFENSDPANVLWLQEMPLNLK